MNSGMRYVLPSISTGEVGEAAGEGLRVQWRLSSRPMRQ